MKTYKDWNGDLGDYLKVGDVVDQEMADYFLNVMPPACWKGNLIQIGEPYNHINGKATYATILSTTRGWEYRGHCHRGQTEEPKQDDFDFRRTF